ncbi:PD-(D/E)XK nuclease family protein [Maridesulfovibrio sp.]|uniref:PD-(D/E)XK nuclease family protein n=1 Tax=Maridesulfovibrio sp. TaxID=2795000 RepID=UPI002A188D20|nr:PD-(D/E)XK nuclease family protein [Maridesulfovibrio sp.]
MMSNGTPVRIISWKQDFIESLASLLISESGGDLSAVTVIVPHHRPARYLKKALAASENLPKPCILPEIYSFSDFVSRLIPRLTASSPRRIGRLDQVGLLFRIIERLRTESSGPLSAMPAELQQFFPWGTRLASLLEELLRQDIKPRNLEMLQGEVMEWAAALLAELETIYVRYVEELERRGWTTPGLEARNLVRNLDGLESVLGGRKLYLAGFYGLSGVEDIFFRYLWEELGLTIIWHGDPALAEGENGHFAVKEHRNWLRDWKAQAVSESPAHGGCALPDLKFFEGFDRHSQLAAMREEICARESGDCAVILPDTSLLLPVMHHLPEQDVNISMGYPLERSALGNLVEAVLTLQENRNGNTFRWRDILGLIRHPYLKMLEVDGDQPLRTIFHQWETVLRNGAPYTDPDDFSPVYSAADGSLIAQPEITEELRAEVVRVCIDGFRDIETLSELADALQAMAEMLRNRGGTLWNRYLLDSECLFRLMNEVIPELRESSLGNEIFGRSLCFSIFRQLLSAQRVSFEPDPISGLQVLGMLESRLLTFRRTFILDTVEEKLPGTDPYDPLLPDPLRHLLGLPDSRERESVATYNFYRLIMGSEETCIFYQSGVQPGLLDSRSIRSRFVEQLLWEIEQRQGKIITPSDNFPLKAVSFPVGAIVNTPASIPKEPVAGKLRSMLKNKGLSPSALDCYVGCPKNFFFRYLSGVRECATVDQEGDRAGFGDLIHSVLKDFLLPHMGQEICGKDLDGGRLEELFLSRLERDSLYIDLPYDIRKSLAGAGCNRLSLFLDNIGQTEVLELESDSRTEIEIEGLKIGIKGRIDRVDLRGGERHVLDYKTGGLHLPKKSFWSDESVWGPVFDSPEEISRDGSSFLETVKREADSLQLPLYLLMDHSTSGKLPRQAALVELVKEGREKELFDADMEAEERQKIIENKIPALTGAIIGNMLHEKEFRPIRSGQCQWCPYREACGS